MNSHTFISVIYLSNNNLFHKIISIYINIHIYFPVFLGVCVGGGGGGGVIETFAVYSPFPNEITPFLD